MSLEWSTERCRKGGVPDTDEEAGERDTLVWASVSLGMQRLTTRNASEWVARLAILDRMNVSPLRVEKADLFRMLDRWAGLETNVVQLTRNQWMRRKVDNTLKLFADAAVGEFEEREKA